MNITPEDLTSIQNGTPPQDPEIVELLTAANDWLETMKTYCIDKVVAAGGSKVKILHGGPSTGKTHYLKYLTFYAAKSGLFVVNIDLSLAEFHLTDSVAFYRAVASELDSTKLEAVVMEQIVFKLGYDISEFKAFGGTLSDYLCEREGSDPVQAKKDIRNCINAIVNTMELDFSFRKFLHIFMEAVVDRNMEVIHSAQSWIRGEKLERTYRVNSLLYETLSKHNARSWLYSLIEILKMIGYKGMMVCIDQLEAILPKAEAKVFYTAMKRNDCYQFLRQLIDDLDFFHNVLFIISGRSEIVSSEKYGLPSYHALWMRIQPGYNQTNYLNSYADLIDADLLFRDIQQRGQLDRLKELMYEMKIPSTDSRETNRSHSHPEYKNYYDLIQNSSH